MKNKELIDLLRSKEACEKAITWLGKRTLNQAWAECRRGDWLLWFAAQTGAPKKKVVLAACACARLALKYVPKEDALPLRAIEAAEGWAHDGLVTSTHVALCAKKAYAASPYTIRNSILPSTCSLAASDAAYSAVYYAAIGVTDATFCADAPAFVGYAAASAAGRSPNAAVAAASSAKANRRLARLCANAVRKHIKLTDLNV